MAEDSELRADEFFRILMRFIQEEQKAITDLLISQSALLQAVFETRPELADAYIRHYERAKASSPVALQTDEIVAELDRFAQRATAESDHKE